MSDATTTVGYSLAARRKDSDTDQWDVGQTTATLEQLHDGLAEELKDAVIREVLEDFDLAIVEVRIVEDYVY